MIMLNPVAKCDRIFFFFFLLTKIKEEKCTNFVLFVWKFLLFLSFA